MSLTDPTSVYVKNSQPLITLDEHNDVSLCSLTLGHSFSMVR